MVCNNPNTNVPVTSPVVTSAPVVKPDPEKFVTKFDPTTSKYTFSIDGKEVAQNVFNDQRYIYNKMNDYYSGDKLVETQEKPRVEPTYNPTTKVMDQPTFDPLKDTVKSYGYTWDNKTGAVIGNSRINGINVTGEVYTTAMKKLESTYTPVYTKEQIPVYTEERKPSSEQVRDKYVNTENYLRTNVDFGSLFSTNTPAPMMDIYRNSKKHIDGSTKIINPITVPTDQYLPYVNYSNPKVATTQIGSAGKPSKPGVGILPETYTEYAVNQNPYTKDWYLTAGNGQSFAPTSIPDAYKQSGLHIIGTTKTNRDNTITLDNISQKYVPKPPTQQELKPIVYNFDSIIGNGQTSPPDYSDTKKYTVAKTTRKQKQNKKSYVTIPTIKPSVMRQPELKSISYQKSKPVGIKGFDGKMKKTKQFGSGINVSGYASMIKTRPLGKDVKPVAGFQVKKNKINTDALKCNVKFGKTLLKQPKTKMFKF
jgi:hypothetical protein